MAMKIVAHKNVKVKDLVEGYINNPHTGQASTMNGKLNELKLSSFFMKNGGMFDEY